MNIFCYGTVNGQTILAEEIKCGELTYLRNPFRLEKLDGNKYEVYQLAWKLVEYSDTIFSRKFPVIQSVKDTYKTLCESRLRGELKFSSNLDQTLQEYLYYSQRNPSNN